MNRKNIEKLIQRLKEVEYVAEGKEDPTSDMQFNMGSFAFHCDSPACIAGHAVALSGEPLIGILGLTIFTKAKKFLELSNEEAQQIFLPKLAKPLSKFTPAMAVYALTRLLADDPADTVWYEAWNAEYPHERITP